MRKVSLLSIPKTALEIVVVLKKAGRPLLIKDIAKYLGKSERTVRRYIGVLVEKGIVTKDVVVTSSKRLAYLYFLPTKEVFEKMLTEDISNLVKRVYGSQ